MHRALWPAADLTTGLRAAGLAVGVAFLPTLYHLLSCCPAGCLARHGRLRWAIDKTAFASVIVGQLAFTAGIAAATRTLVFLPALQTDQRSAPCGDSGQALALAARRAQRRAAAGGRIAAATRTLVVQFASV